MSGGGPGKEHERAECIARAATAAAAKDQDQRAAHADGDPFAAVPWSAARYRFVSALDALAKVTVRRYPGGGERPDEERRHNELEIAKACAAVCLAVKWPDGARAGWAMASAEARDSRDRIAQLEDELAEYRKATASKTPADAHQSALEQATSERDAALRSWEALRDQFAAAEVATEQARRERDAAERDRAVLRSRVAELERGIAGAKERAAESATRAARLEEELQAAPVLRPAEEPGTLAAVRRDFAAELQRRDDRIDALEAKVSPENKLSLAGIRVQCEKLYAHIFREGGMGEQHADLLTRVDILERGLATSVEARLRERLDQ